jgi:hypothetical protein
MDVSSNLDIDINVLDTGITPGQSTIIPVNASNDGVSTGADGSASIVQVSFSDFTYYMLTVYDILRYPPSWISISMCWTLGSRSVHLQLNRWSTFQMMVSF